MLSAGREPAWPLDRAGRLAVAAHLRDQDDLHLGTITHPGGVVWSAVVACEPTLGDAVEAAAFSYELVVRLAEAAGPEHRQRWHATATAGTVGAAGAAARLLRADEADAVAHAASVAGGSSQALIERSGTRFLHRAHAASAGVACARAAAARLSGSRGVLGSGRGALGELVAAPLAPRGSAAIEETHFRLHPATGFAHAAIEAALALGPLEPERVRVTVSPPAAVALASNRAPANDDERWWSVEHAVASCFGLKPERVELEPGGPGWGAKVEATLADGTVRAAYVDRPRVATDDDLLAKWRRLTGTDGSPFFRRLTDAADDEPLADLVPF